MINVSQPVAWKYEQTAYYQGKGYIKAGVIYPRAITPINHKYCAVETEQTAENPYLQSGKSYKLYHIIHIETGWVLGIWFKQQFKKAIADFDAFEFCKEESTNKRGVFKTKDGKFTITSVKQYKNYTGKE